MTDIVGGSDLIAGGIETNGVNIILGGVERVVGENVKSNTRIKFIELKHLSKSNKTTAKELLKIIKLSIPISFNKSVFYNDSRKMPHTTNLKNTNIINKKAVDLLKKYLDYPVTKIIDNLTVEYNLRAPLYWALSDIVKFLAITNKKKRKNARKIKISPEMALTIEGIWNNKSYFRYVIKDDSVPDDLIKLLLHILQSIENTRPPKGVWECKDLSVVKFPQLNKKEIEKKIKEEKEDLVKRLKSCKNEIKKIQEYIFSILKIENILLDHMNNIEKYYIEVAKNLNKILKGLKGYFTSI